VIHSRTYLGTTSERGNGTPEDTGNADKVAEDRQDAVPPLSELETKLKAKEDEALDLTVRLARWLINQLPSLTCHKILGSATIPTGGLPEPPTKRRP